MITFTDSIVSNLCNDIECDIIYFDFAKAFDTVNQDLILAKLKQMYGVKNRLLSFLRDYLKDRKQRVTLNNIFSEFKKAKSGVPQGSILSPLLFVLFINDIGKKISPGTNICLYVDGTKIWRPMKSERDCLVLQNDIDYLNKWCHDNLMKFHPKKCKVLSIKFNRKSSLLESLPMSKFSYQLGNSILDYEDSENDLGVTVNKKFSWLDHQSLIISKAAQMLGLTKRTCHFTVNPRQKRTLYLALVRSQFEHCSEIWRPVLSAQIDKFERIQKRL